MGFFDWIFGSSRRPGERTPAWHTSENGNPTLLHDGVRATVFPQDRGWKFVIGDDDDETEPFFSERFRSEDEAKAAALKELGLS